MKKIPSFINYVTFISLFFSSCNLKFYAPTTAITPLFREKGETQISGHLGNGNEIDQSLQFQVASAIDSHLAVYGSLYKAEGGFDKDIENDQNYGLGSQFELAIGYFKTISPKLSYEVYGGIASGNATNHYTRTYQSDSLGTRSFPLIIKNKCFKPYVQGNFGYRSKFFDAAFNLKLGYLLISGIHETFPEMDTSYKGVPVGPVDNIKSRPNSFLIEPGLTLRIGYEPLKLQFHMTQSYNSNGDKYPQEGVIYSLGVVGMINSATRKHK